LSNDNLVDQLEKRIRAKANQLDIKSKIEIKQLD
jgi:(E)-4-hydroxy-3-methylbut-2-enyl-diphosphate synthase